MFIIIAAIQINEKYCDIYLIEHSVIAYMQISHALHDDWDRNGEMPVRDHHYWMGILMMLVKLNLQDKQRWRRSNIKEVQVLKRCLSL